MISKSSLVHLRIPFFLFLLPVFLFAINVADKPVLWKTVLVFFILHFLLYPASNSFNSYYDRDAESIGTLRNPPPIEKELLILSLSLDALAIALGFFISPLFALAIFVYGMASKAYSHHKIRIKKKPFLSLIWVSFGQGAATFFISYYGVQNISLTNIFSVKTFFAAIVCSFFLLAAYPLTQIYQHDADRKNGDTTYSMRVGIRGTFLSSAIFFIFSFAGFIFYYFHFYGMLYAAAFAACLLLPAAFFIYWMTITFKDEKKANYENTMRLNFISSTALNLYLLAVTAIKYATL
jgi:1,4-dihydroxy-2-naphthoate octaprenyltransferase